MAEPVQADQRDSTIWSWWFIGLCAVVVLAGCIIASLGVSGIGVSALVAVNFTSGNQATLVAYGGLLVACLVALWRVRDRLQQAGLVLQVGAVACAIAGVVFSLRPVSTATSPALVSAISALGIASAVLNLPSLVYLSYGIAAWRQSERRYVVPIQVGLTLVLGFLLLLGVDALRVLYPPQILMVYCNVAAVMVMLARPACWKAQPLITVCLTVGRLASLIYSDFVFRHLLVMPAVLRFQLLYTFNVGATVLFILGVLQLAQIARMQAGKALSLDAG